jgi:hypothetical protein
MADEPTQEVPVSPIHVTGEVDLLKVNGQLKRSVRNDRLKAAGIFLLGVSAFVSSLIAWSALQNAEEIRQDNQCRAQVNFETQNLSDQVLITTSQIFVEAIRRPSTPGSPNPEVQRLGGVLDEEIQHLDAAIVARERAIEECDTR